MTLQPARALGWPFEAVLTSDEITFLQAELLKAIDGTGGGTYELAAPLVFDGEAVRFRNVLELDDGGEFVVRSDASWLLEGDGEISGEWLLSGAGVLTGDLEVESAAQVNFVTGTFLRIDTSAFLTAVAGSIVTLGGTVNFHASSSVTFNSTLLNLNAILNVLSGARVDIESGALLNVLAGGIITMSHGALLTVDDAEDITLNFSSFTFRATLTPASMTWNAGVPMFMPWLGTPVWQMTDVSAPGAISYGIPLLPGDRLTTLACNMGNPTVNAHGTVPGIRPRLQLVAVNINGGETVLAETTDPVNVLPAYDDTHTITLSNATNTAGPSPATFFPYTVPADIVLLARVTNERDGGSPGSASPNKTCVLSVYGTGEAMHYRNTSEIL